MAGRNIIVDDEDHSRANGQSTQEQALVSWVLDRVRSWRDHRDTNYLPKWDEYYRLWRGIWNRQDSSRASERSKLISPALQQAVESTVAELEEATFGKGAWFDLEDDIEDEEEKAVLEVLRDRLLYDLEKAHVPHEVSKIFLNGALYGTGIGKILVEEEPNRTVIRGPVGEPLVQEEAKFTVKLETVDPREFVIDPAARNIDEALGCAHEVIKPTHLIRDRQLAGIYNDVDLGGYVDDHKFGGMSDTASDPSDDKTKIVEYYGKVPVSLLPVEVEDGEEIVELSSENIEEDQAVATLLAVSEDDEMVEAIVTIANDQVLLRAVENRYIMKDRPFIAYQHDTVPNKFWGRGVCEKGYNPQKALDAELRARIDSMALATYPMLAADATRLPRGINLTARPGKVFLTNGDPRQTFMPLQFAHGINSSTFHQSGDLERMIQMGTGAMDSATPVSQSPRNATASGMSMMQSGFIKRSKRTMKNISSQFLRPLIKKSAWRYMQFDYERYPVANYDFKTVASMGIMAREYEQGQLTQLLSIVPPDSEVFQLLMKGIFENSSLANKSDLMRALNATLEPDPQQQELAQMQMQMAMNREQLEQAKIRMEIDELESRIFERIMEAQASDERLRIDALRADLEALRAIRESMNPLPQLGAPNGRSPGTA